MSRTGERVELLFGQIREYVDTNYEIIRLKAIYHTSETASKAVHGACWVLCALFFLVFLSISVALFLGDLWDNAGAGFLAVGAFYLITGIIVFSLKTATTKRISDTLIKTMLKEEKWTK